MCVGVCLCMLSSLKKSVSECCKLYNSWTDRYLVLWNNIKKWAHCFLCDYDFIYLVYSFVFWRKVSNCQFAFVILWCSVQFNNNHFHLCGSVLMNISIKSSVILEHSKYECYFFPFSYWSSHKAEEFKVCVCTGSIKVF